MKLVGKVLSYLIDLSPLFEEGIFRLSSPYSLSPLPNAFDPQIDENMENVFLGGAEEPLVQFAVYAFSFLESRSFCLQTFFNATNLLFMIGKVVAWTQFVCSFNHGLRGHSKPFGYFG